MNRPKIIDYVGDMSLIDIQNMYSNTNLWSYIRALDAYIDELEDNDTEVNEGE